MTEMEKKNKRKGQTRKDYEQVGLQEASPLTRPEAKSF
jgi:hypothetical protein